MLSENVFCVIFTCVILLHGSKHIFDSQTESTKSQVFGLMKVLAPYCHISFIRLKLIMYTSVWLKYCQTTATQKKKKRIIS